MSSTAKKENVWDYPRPPAIEPTSRHLRVIYDDNGTEIVLADTTKAFRILETSHPPTYYIPPSDTRIDLLTKNTRATFCEWKGTASYYDFTPPSQHSPSATVHNRIWFYENPNGTGGKYKDLKGYLCFYVGPWRCFVDGEEVKAQPGDFYGGWLTSDIEGEGEGRPWHVWVVMVLSRYVTVMVLECVPM